MLSLKEFLSETVSNYMVTVHQETGEGTTEHKYKITKAQDERHAKSIAMLRHFDFVKKSGKHKDPSYGGAKTHSVVKIKEALEHLEEGNLLQQRVNKHLAKGVSIGAISPEGSHTDTKESLHDAHKQIKTDLESARSSGHIGGWSGPHRGQYRYGSNPHEVAKEGSYIVHATDSNKDSHHRMVTALKHIGTKHNQESVLSVNAKKSANWHYLRGEKEGTKEYQGKLKYNKPLTYDEKKQEGTGRTELKRGGHSFTSEK